jgi:hypothetical protein
MATINIQGLMTTAKREEVEAWMTEYKIDFMVVTETHIPTDHE